MHKHIATLYLDHLGEIRRFLFRKLACIDIASELANEVFVRRMVTGSTVDNERTFLFRIAENLALDHFRAQAGTAGKFVDIDDCHDLASEVPGPERYVIARQQLRRLREAIDEFPPHCREVFVRHKFDGLLQKELAAEYGITVSAIEKLLVRALLHLRLAVNWA